MATGRWECLLTWIQRLLSLLALTAGANYIVWRWRRVVDTSYFISVPFVVSETLLILLGSGCFYLQTMCTKPRAPKRLADLGMSDQRFPPVDVLIPTLREPLEVVEATLRAAMAIDYPPHKLSVYLLDDGGSPDAKDLVTRLSRDEDGQTRPALHYIARLRKPGLPHHAKAGNLNHAIFEGDTSGEYILLLDCDMVCQPHILHAVLPHFYSDPDQATLLPSLPLQQVAMVQTPQSFYNVAPCDPLNDQSPLFYYTLMPGWDYWASAPCCGTNVVFQRKALCEVGGFAYSSVTEDFLTSLNLKAAGFQTKYVSAEVLAEGLAPEGLQAFFEQRLRWAVGGLQIWRYSCPLVKKGALGLPQRLLYSWAGAHYILSLPTLLVICTPFIFLLGEGAILLTTGTVRDYASYFLPYFALHMLVVALSHRRIPNRRLLYFLRTQQESVYLVFNHLRACLVVLLGMQFAFKVTPKDGRRELLQDLPYALLPLVFVVVGSACAVQGLLEVAFTRMDTPVLLAYIINLLWSLMILLEMAQPVVVLFRLHYNDDSEGDVEAGHPRKEASAKRGGYSAVDSAQPGAAAPATLAQPPVVTRADYGSSPPKPGTQHNTSPRGSWSQGAAVAGESTNLLQS